MQKDLVTKRGFLFNHIALPLVFAFIVLIIFFHKSILPSLHLSYLFLCMTIPFLITTTGRLRFQKESGEKPQWNYFPWLMMIFATQIVMVLLFLGVGLATFHSLISGQEAYYAQASISATTIRSLLLDWGLFPWPIYALTAGLIAYNAYNRDRSGPPSDITLDFASRKSNFFMYPIISYIFTHQNILAINVSIALGILQFIKLLCVIFHVPHMYAFIGQTVIIAIVIYAITLICQKRMIGKVNENRFSLTIWLVTYAVAVSLIVFLINWLVQTQITLHAGSQFHNVAALKHLSFVNHGKWINYWLYFTWGWWLIWTPFVASFFARISKGRSIKQLTLGILLLPFIVATTWSLGYYSPQSFPLFAGIYKHLTLFFGSSFFQYALPILGLAFVIALLHKNTKRIDLGFMEKSGHKFHRPSHYVPKVTIILTVLICLFLVSWLLIIPFLVFIYALVLVAFLLACLFAYYVLVLQDVTFKAKKEKVKRASGWGDEE